MRSFYIGGSFRYWLRPGNSVRLFVIFACQQAMHVETDVSRQCTLKQMSAGNARWNRCQQAMHIETGVSRQCTLKQCQQAMHVETDVSRQCTLKQVSAGNARWNRCQQAMHVETYVSRQCTLKQIPTLFAHKHLSFIRRDQTWFPSQKSNYDIDWCGITGGSSESRRSRIQFQSQ